MSVKPGHVISVSVRSVEERWDIVIIVIVSLDVEFCDWFLRHNIQQLLSE